MSKYKNVLFPLLALLVTLSMTACQTPTPATTEVSIPTEVQKPTEVPPTETPSPTEIQVIGVEGCRVLAPEKETVINMIGWSFPIMDFYAAELEKCDKVDNLTINTNLLASADAKEQVRLALSAGGTSPYDIVHGANGEVGAWGGAGWLLPLNDLIEKYWDEYNLGDIPEKAWEGASIDWKIYGVPIVANTLHLIYRKDVLEKYGIAVPETYDDVIAMCNTIGLDNPEFDMPFTINLSAGWGWELEFFHFLRAYGGDFLDKDNNPIFNGLEGIKAVEKLIKVANACMGADGYSFSLNDQEVAMQLGTLPATNMWASRAANMTDPSRTSLGDLIAYAPAPRLEAGTPRAGSAWNDYYMIPATTANDPDLIFRIIMEIADEESQREAAKLGMVTRLSLANAGGPYLPAAYQTIIEGVGIYDKSPAIRIVRAKLSEFLPLVGTGEMTAQQALDAAASAYIEEAKAQGFIK